MFGRLGNSKYDHFAVEVERNPSKRNSCVWLKTGEKRPQVASLRAQTHRKIIQAIAFTANKHLCVNTYHSGTIMDSETYLHFRKEDR